MKMWKSSEFADMTGLSRETLRYYAEVKLLEPAYIDPANNYRYYDDGSYFLAVLLGKLRHLGFTIQEMTAVMQDESLAHLEELLTEKKNKLRKQIAELERKVGEIDEFLASGKEDEGNGVEGREDHCSEYR